MRDGQHDLGPRRGRRAIVETALVLLAFIALLAGLVDLGRMLGTRPSGEPRHVIWGG